VGHTKVRCKVPIAEDPDAGGANGYGGGDGGYGGETSGDAGCSGGDGTAELAPVAASSWESGGGGGSW
jgi:hypothetical protein